MVTIAFDKMHGCGNDFVVLDGRRTPVELTPAQIRRIGDRHRGVGFDQLVVLGPAAGATASAGLIGAIPAISAALSGAVEAAYDQKVTVPAGALRVGDIVRIKGRVRVTAGATADTLAIKVKYGALAVLSVAATDYAADSCVTFDITVKVLSATTAAITSLFVAGVLGTASTSFGERHAPLIKSLRQSSRAQALGLARARASNLFFFC